MREDDLDAILTSQAARRPLARLTWLGSGRQQLVHEASDEEPAIAEVVSEAMRRDRSGVVAIAGEDVFVEVFNPPLRMLMIGAVHIAQALIPFARQGGYDVTIIDPRTAFATPERFPGVSLLAAWPDEVMAGLALDRRTAVIALTHDPKIDDPALLASFASEAFYIGALGSKRTHATRRERLLATGVSERALARMHAPIGLDIGAEGAFEIALSIMAEVTAVLRGKATRATVAGAGPDKGEQAASAS